MQTSYSKCALFHKDNAPVHKSDLCVLLLLLRMLVSCFDLESLMNFFLSSLEWKSPYHKTSRLGVI